MANTYELIGSVTVSAGGASTISFASIPGTYTDLVVRASLRYDTNLTAALMTFNGSSSGYSYRSIFGYPPSAASYSGSSQTELQIQYVNGVNTTSSTFNSTDIYIPSYASSTQKSVSWDTVMENNSSSSASQILMAGLWTGTSAISSIAITAAPGSNFVQYSTANLYGVKNA